MIDSQLQHMIYRDIVKQKADKSSDEVKFIADIDKRITVKQRPNKGEA